MDEFSKEELEQVFSVFRDQSMQILEDIGQDLLLLESKGIDEEALSRLKRGAHTIKGDSACVGLEGVTEIAHGIEDILSLVADGKLELTAEVVDRLFSNIDAIREAICGEEIRDIPGDEIAALLSSNEEVAGGRGNQRSGETGEGSEDAKPGGGEVSIEGREKEAEKRARGKKDYVRVEPGRIDTLLNLAGEMVIARSLLGQILPELEAALPRSELVARLNGAGIQIGKLTSELQKSVLKMRMVRIGTVFKRFARPMRELAAERGKLVELVTEGDETELDRGLVDSLYEPLLHLLRNAVDHGIETSAERISQGKPAEGRIKLSAYHEGNQVVVEVSDDGCGIDCASLKKKAVESEAVGYREADQLFEEQALELIFLQGVSTAEEVTWVSGRGIGMAAVRSAIEQMRGTVNVRSARGEGTTFVIRMPLTLAIIRGLLFRSSGQYLALPLLSVSEIVRADVKEITLIDEFESLRHRGGFISIIRPGQVLGFERRKGGSGAMIRGGGGRAFIIVLNAGAGKYGVIADELLGEQELVIKPLEGRWVQNEALAGASVLGDGRVVLIMDAGAIIRKGIRYERKRVEARGGYGNRG
jgi:two-component system chemotaxis sensor kinase CheA